MISAKGVRVVRQGRTILNDINIDLVSGKVLGLVGPNGSGKTTLLRALYWADQLDGGDVLLDGISLGRLSRRQIARRIAVAPQNHAIDGDTAAADMVMLGRLPHMKLLRSPDRDDEEIVETALERVGLAAKAAHPLSQLSGGERQRVLIARALGQRADHLLLDEPTNHLDLNYQHEILELIRSLAMTTLIVLHDLNLAARYCDAIALIDRGQILAFGSPEQVLEPERITAAYRIPTTRISTPAGRPHLLFSDDNQP